MPQYDDDDYDYEDNDREDGFASLRKANRQKDKRIKELESQLSQLQGTVRKSTVESVIQAKGLNPKIAALLPGEITAPDEIEKWLTEYGDLFAPAQAGEPESSPAAPEGQGTPPELDPDIAARQRLATVQAGGRPVDQSDLKQLEDKIRAATSPEELNILLHGNPYGPQI